MSAHRALITTLLPAIPLNVIVAWPVMRLCRVLLRPARASIEPGTWRSGPVPSPPYGEERSSSRRFLPRDPKAQEPYRLTPGLALRVGVLGAIALVVFGTLFFRLWSLQILSGATYLATAQDNQLRTIRVEAPRGAILDRDGR